jgi:hypothetical protein
MANKRNENEYVLKSEVKSVIQNYIRTIQMNDYGNDGGIPQLYWAMGLIDQVPTADVVPKSELDDLQSLLDATIAGQETLQKALDKEKIKADKYKNAAKIANEEHMKVLNHYFIDTTIGNGTPLQRAKAEVAREIFEEIEALRLKHTCGEIDEADLNIGLYELKKKHADNVPIENKRKYFTPDEVRQMPPEKIRENYDAIFESMRKW